MNAKTILAGICWLGLTAASFAYVSRYSSMAVSGSAFTNYWTIAPNMELVGDNLWQGTQEITNGTGGFKFAANDNWTFSWGGDAALARVPAAGRAQRDFIGNNLEFSGLTPGAYLFTFNDETLDFRLDWNGAEPLPPPAIDACALVGDFNSRAPTFLHRLTNDLAAPRLWSCAIDLGNPAAFHFRLNGDPNDPWGATEPAVLSVPTGNVGACGQTDFRLAGLEPGTFRFTLDASNAACSVVQTATQEVSDLVVQGDFIATNAPPPNMTWVDNASWESDHHVTNSGTITLRFAARNGAVCWGATNAWSLPASGTLMANRTNFAQISGVAPGRYRITFNHRTGAFTFDQAYAETSGLNLLQNPGFEITTWGNADGWTANVAGPRCVAEGFAPHSGNWCGSMDVGSFAQDVPVVAGKNYRASAWLKATPEGTANSMQIRVQWLNAATGTVGRSASVDAPNPRTRWTKYFVEAAAPPDARYARVAVFCTNAETFDCMHVDDAEFRTVNRRTEDFSGWTDSAYAVPGDHAWGEWNLQGASISADGVLGSLSARLAPTNGAVVSPVFDDGVGRTLFWAKPVDPIAPAYLLLQTSTNGDEWTPQASFAATNGALHSAWLHVAAAGSQARIVFDPAKTSGAVFVDNIEIFAPTLHRDQNFDDWPTRASYTSEFHQGWFVANCTVSELYADEGQAARLNSALGNYVQSPEMPDGIGSISFRTRKMLISDAAATLQVQLSSNGLDWTTATSVSPASTNYQPFAFFLQDATNRFVRLYHSAGASRVLVDGILIGVPQPRPEVLATHDLDPGYPTTDEPLAITANVAARYEASILSVTGYYRIASGPWTGIPMADAGAGAYVSVSNVPGQPAGTRISHYVRVRYAGIGAATNSTGFGTNALTTSTGTVTVATVPRGHAWINELYYAPYGPNEPTVVFGDPPEIHYTGCNHEYLELCGRAGTDIGRWTLQLAFGAEADIAANAGQTIYASYAIPSNTVFADQTNGFGFYVFGDSLLADQQPVDQVFTTLVPASVVPDAGLLKDHFHDGVGVVRLLDQFSNVVYSLSYNGDVPGSDRILPTQLPLGETNSIGLSAGGSDYAAFEWSKGNGTIGGENDGQTLVAPRSGTNACAWHDQGLKITPLDTNAADPFCMLNPQGAGHFSAIDVCYGYTNAAYPNPSGILSHRPGGIGAPWTSVAMSIRPGAVDSNGHGYVSGRIPDHAYRRLQTIEYVIEVDPGTNGVDNVFLASDADGLNLSTPYANFAAAEAHPFTYAIPIADRIAITDLAADASGVTLQTAGNDPVDPLTNFTVKFTADLRLPANEWSTATFIATPNGFSNYSFQVQADTSVWPKAFYRIDPLWP